MSCLLLDFIVILFSEISSNSFKPTCVAWQPGSQYSSSIVIGSESGQLIYKDSRQGASPTAYSQPHIRNIHRLCFAPHRLFYLLILSSTFVASTQVV